MAAYYQGGADGFYWFEYSNGYCTFTSYWSTDAILAHPWFRTIMSRDQFMELMRYFHFVDNTTAPSQSDPHYNKLWKIQPLVEYFNPVWYNSFKWLSFCVTINKGFCFFCCMVILLT